MGALDWIWAALRRLKGGRAYGPRPEGALKTDEEIAEKVLTVLAEELLLARGAIKLSDKVMGDLCHDGDEISYDVIPRIEQELGILVPLDNWATAYTVGDMVSVLREARDALRRELGS